MKGSCCSSRVGAAANSLPYSVSFLHLRRFSFVLSCLAGRTRLGEISPVGVLAEVAVAERHGVATAPCIFRQAIEEIGAQKLRTAVSVAGKVGSGNHQVLLLVDASGERRINHDGDSFCRLFVILLFKYVN